MNVISSNPSQACIASVCPFGSKFCVFNATLGRVDEADFCCHKNFIVLHSDPALDPQRC